MAATRSGLCQRDVAARGIGKSSLAIVEGVAMASGDNLLGIQPAKALRVWYGNVEDPARGNLAARRGDCLHF